ncbi:uncharacterized protein LOC141910892 [Tubulanus polymorphus]|uniref:uncharacterized protein LOC141910892 n=1 Tax=Tubulanus polymorphus TaxID=672921 RepID=UPI003DA302A8
MASRGLSRPGSRDSRVESSAASSMFGSAHAVNRRLLDSPGTLNVLPPEEFSDQDSDIAIEDLDDGSDFSDEYTDEELQLIGASSSRIKHSKQDDYQVTKQLVISGYDPNIEEEEIDSEEENEIVKEIKEEIKRQVKDEMKSELAVYQQPPKFDEGTNQSEDAAGLEDVDPDMRAAILKMRKYDRILKKKMKREKEVKRDRLRLQKRLREELDALKTDGGKKEPKEESTNTAKFLALEPPPSHNEGVTLDSGDESPPVTPVFRTQPPDTDTNTTTNSQTSTNKPNSSRKSNNSTGRQTDTSLGGSSLGSRASNTDRKKHRKKDFIKRNIKLASDAGNVIAMTDDEKNRLEDLLKDVDRIEDIPEEHTDRDAMLDIALPPGIGFRPEINEEHHLKDIDNRLKALLPPEEFSVYAAQVTVNPLNHCLFTRTDVRNVDIDELGEQALKETKEQREMRIRLEQIEADLAELSQHKDLVVETPKLSDETLNSLLDECCRSLSRTTVNTSELNTARSSSSRISMLENPPKLPPDILEDLLAEARAEQGSSLVQQVFDADGDSGEITEENESDELKARRMISNNDDSFTSLNSKDDLNIESLTDDQIQELLRQSYSRQSLRNNSEITPRNRRKSSNERIKLPEINHSGSLVSQQINNPSINNHQRTTRWDPDEINDNRDDTSRSRTGEGTDRPRTRDGLDRPRTGEVTDRSRTRETVDRPITREGSDRPRTGEGLDRPMTGERSINNWQENGRIPLEEYPFSPQRPDTGDGPRTKSRRSVNYKSQTLSSDDEKPW